MAVFSLFVAAVAVGFVFFVQNQFQTDRHAVEDQLRLVAELKVSHLDAWRQERVGDAAVVANVPGLAEALTPMAAAPAAWSSRQSEIDRYLNGVLQAYSYRHIQLLDGALKPVRNYPSDRTWDGVLSPQIRAELLRPNAGNRRAEAPLVEDLHFDESGAACLHLLVRVRADSGDLAGVVVLAIAAEKSLFPVVQSWPVESKTAETLLVRREGDFIQYLSAPRSAAGAATHLRLPFDQPDLLAAKAFRPIRGGWCRPRITVGRRWSVWSCRFRTLRGW